MKKVLFETHHLYYWPNFLPIVQELKRRNQYDIHVSIPKRSSCFEQNILMKVCNDIDIRFITANSEVQRIKNIFSEKYDIIIVGNIGKLNKIVRKGTKAIMVYHGIGLKQSYYNDMHDRIDLRAVESVSRYNKLKNTGCDNLVLTGFTKLDRLFTIPDGEIEKKKNMINLDQSKKTILYAPSYYPTSIEKVCPLLPDLNNDFNIIIKLHGFSWEKKKYYYQNALCNELDKANENIHLLKNYDYDIIPYYKMSDMLLTDLSSTMFEYLPINKPIIQVQCYTLKFMHKIFKNRFFRKIDYQRMLNVNFTYHIKDPSELLSRVYYAIDNIDEMSSQRINATEHYLYKLDGKASSRLIDAFED